MPDSKIVTAGEWRALDEKHLVSGWDNASQTVMVPLAPPYFKIALKELAFIAEGSHLPKLNLEEAMSQFLHYHSHIKTVQEMFLPGKHPRTVPAVPKRELRQFYSLIYHLLPEDGTEEVVRGVKNDGRGHIKAFFDTLNLGEPLSERDVAVCLPVIMKSVQHHARVGGLA